MTFIEFFILIGIFIGLLFLYKYAGRFVKQLSPKAVKTVNWTAFAVAVLSGIAWLAFNDSIFMLFTLAGVIVYFLFYNYEAPEEKGGDASGQGHD